MDRLIEIFFLPPMAIARLGSGSEPLCSFEWTESPAPLDGPDTIIAPAVSLQVEKDGRVTPYLPESVAFKDADGIRPVAPFLELWARLQSAEDGTLYDAPLTLDLLKTLGVALRDVRYEIAAVNRKAERRTGLASCSFVARAVVKGDDHGLRDLMAFSPHTSGQEPLVKQDKPIPLGTFQVIRPVNQQISVDGKARSVDCSILRVRFTPPKGYVYGPPTAMTGPAPEVQPGVYEAAATQFGRIHEIVPPERRILNDKTVWSQGYIMMNGHFEDPPPQDGYDGAAVGDFKSWGCVDDTSDSLVEALLAVDGRLYRAAARILTSPPDFAPDRRPVYSVADDLADRELAANPVDGESYEDTKDELLDLFHRAFETASLFNLDAIRARGLLENRNRLAARKGPDGPDAPKAGDGSMTAEDTPYVDKLPVLAPQKPSRFTATTPNHPLPYSAVVSFIHARMTDEVGLIDLLKQRGDHVERVVRPAFARVADLPDTPNQQQSADFRDPRVFRDQLHDMRMPPYMRDANLQPLSISRRQYNDLKAFIALLTKRAANGGTEGTS